jgi:hypothetical protein
MSSTRGAITAAAAGQRLAGQLAGAKRLSHACPVSAARNARPFLTPAAVAAGRSVTFMSSARFPGA